MNRTGTVSAKWVNALAALDREGICRHLADFDTDATGSDPAECLWRSEVLGYLDRADRAREELDTAGALLPDALADRGQLIAADLELWDGADRECERIAREVLANARVDPANAARALALVARASCRRGDYQESLLRFRTAYGACEKLGLAYHVGVTLHGVGYAHLKLSDLGAAGAAIHAALDHHAKTGDRRWEGMGRQLLGLWWQDHEQYEKAEAEHERAVELAVSLGIVRDALWAKNNLAQLLVTQSRYDEAVESLRYVLEWTRRGRYGHPECNALVTLAYAFRLRGDAAQAKATAKEAWRVAEMAGADDLRRDAGMMRGWCERDAQAIKAHLLDAELHGSDQQRFKGRLFVADCILETEPETAATLVGEARRLPDAGSGDPYAKMLTILEKRIKLSPIWIDERRGFRCQPHDNGFPDLESAKLDFERWLIKEAIAASNGNRAEAARKLGVTRSHLHTRYRIAVLGEPARPGKPSRLKVKA